MSDDSKEHLEKLACVPEPISLDSFNKEATIPYGCTLEHIYYAMKDFLDFLGFINQQLSSRGIMRLESMLMPANFSSIVGEFMNSAIPKHCPTLVKNRYHNGHPDLVPRNVFSGDSVQHSHIGIEIKASRYPSGWQGHNAEQIWLMVFVFDSNRPVDLNEAISPRPFRFIKVVGAQLETTDWLFSGRSETSRRTITASVTNSGYAKMSKNWIFSASSEATIFAL